MALIEPRVSRAPQRKGPLIAGGVILIVYGTVLLGVGVIGYFYPDNSGAEVVTTTIIAAVGAAQIASGIGSMQRQRVAKITGIVLASVGALFALLMLMVFLSPREEFDINPQTLEITTTTAGPEPAGAVFATLGLLGYVAAIVLLSLGRAASPTSAQGGTSSTMRECPLCREAMRRDASVCPHCRRESEPWFFEAGLWWTEDEDGHLMWLDEAWGEFIPTREDHRCPECEAPMERDDIQCRNCGSHSGFVELAED